MNTPKQRLAMLADMVRQHELYWSELAQHHPTDLMRTFLNSRWDPFYARWVQHLPHAQYIGTWDPAAQDTFVQQCARELSQLRELARYNYIPTPDIGTAQGGTAVAGELDIKHDASGKVTMVHYPDSATHLAIGHSVGHHFGGGGFGGGGWHGAYGGRRYFNMAPGGYGYGYPYAYALPPGCYYDAYGQLVCPPAPGQIPAVAYGPPTYPAYAQPAAYAQPVATPPDLTAAPASSDGSDASVSGWFDSLKDAVLTVTGTKLTNQFIHDNHLEGLVKVAATAVGTYYGGPAGGAAAGALSGPIMSLGVDQKKPPAQQAADAHAAVAQSVAQHGPDAAAIGAQAVQKVAAAYHAAQIHQDAQAGNPAAQSQMNQLAQNAQGGDSGAQQLLGMLGKLASSYGGSKGGGGGGLSSLTSMFGGGGNAGTLRDPNWQVDPNAIEMDAPDLGDAGAAVSGFLSTLLAAGGGFAAGMYGPRGYRWLRGKLDHHAAK